MAITDFALDFRNTSIYVTDPSYAAFASTESYPHTYTNGNGDSVVGGWDLNPGNIGTLNRNSGNDARLAGIAYNQFGNNSGGGNNPARFRLDLPSTGVWLIILAAGDGANIEEQYIILLENGVAFATYAAVATANNSFMDANGSVFTEANWLTSNVALSRTFSSAVFQVEVGPPNPTGSELRFTSLAHLRITKAVTSTLRLLASLGVGT